MGTWVISGRIKNPPRYKMEAFATHIVPKFQFHTYYGNWETAYTKL